MPPLPYVFTEFPNKRLNHTAVAVNAGGARAWRAPNHPQASFLTCSALEDLAAKLRMDPLELFNKNARLHRARSRLQSAIAEGRGNHGVEEALASARRRGVPAPGP
jgi:CO/xanthine dehydrogenase Mo-binding subunit